MLRVRANVTGAVASIREMRMRRRGARTLAVRAIVGDRVRAWLVEAPRDTNRYVRGWAEAAMQVGAEGIVLPQLQRSRYAEAYVGAFERRIAFLAAKLRAVQKILAEGHTQRVTRGGRGRPPVMRRVPIPPSRRARLEHQVVSLEVRIQRVRERLRTFLNNEHAIVIGGGAIYGVTERGDGTAEYRHVFNARKSNPTVRFKIYGGSGTLRHTPTRTTAVLRNKEPHASLLEANLRLSARRTGAALRSAEIRYLNAMAKGRATGQHLARVESLTARRDAMLGRLTGLHAFAGQ